MSRPLTTHRHLLRTVSTCSAVLDLHFSPHVEHIFAIATSTGAIEVYRLDFGETARIELLTQLQAFDPTVLVLSLAWHSSETLVKPATLAVSLSDGRLAIVDYTQDQESIQYVKAHTLEAWTVSWSWRENNLWSGGDDSKLSLSSMKTVAKEYKSLEKLMPRPKVRMAGPELPSHIAEESSDDKSDHSIAKTSVMMDIMQSDTKLHSAGVTAILPIQLANSESTGILFTGSYDEYMRVIEPIQGKRWRILGELHLGGGVWRLKLMPANHKCDAGVWRWRVLASCMHAGSKVIDVTCHHSSKPYEDSRWSFNVLAKFEEHESMNYASDCSALGADEKGVTIASTSFYDKRLCIWSISDIQDP